MKPRIAPIPGDSSGIGPELVAKLLADPHLPKRSHLLLIGDRRVFERGRQQAGTSFALEPCAATVDDWVARAPYAWHPTETLAEGQ